MVFTPEEQARLAALPIEQFDAEMWGTIEAEIDSRTDFEDFETSHPSETREREATLKTAGRD